MLTFSVFPNNSDMPSVGIEVANLRLSFALDIPSYSAAISDSLRTWNARFTGSGDGKIHSSVCCGLKMENWNSH